ncbi:MAG: hypothetical protein JSW46_10740 [Gemmatimonadota bacterium]|nr:MAG: hypothetical protein JSW46_10740 [Gemmatimonadota bacterium]
MPGDKRTRGDELLSVIRAVRRRWRLRVALRGIAVVLGAGTLVFVISAYGLDRLRFDPGAVIAFRVFAYLALGILVLRFLVLPLWRSVSDERVALYLEEHEPSLEARVLSAVEFSQEREGHESSSPAFVQRLVEGAAERCVELDYGRRVEAAPLARTSGLLAGTTLAALAVVFLSPPFVRHSTPFLMPFSEAGLENPYAITVSPGDTRVARGAELKITAQLQNFDAEEVEIAVQRGPAAEWERFPMGIEEETGERQFYLFELNEATEYFVEASGVRSNLFRIEVVDLPYVQGLVLEYHFPAYVGLGPQRQEDGGDIAALRGTEVWFYVTPTVPVAGGAIEVEDQERIALAAEENGTLTGSLRIQRDGIYRIVFESFDGDSVVGSPEYLIDVLADQPPYVSFAKPGRDIKVTNVEEVFTEVDAEDDYGVGLIELVYSVNGGPEEALELYSGSRRAVSAAHTFYLEEFELVPGDFLSYYARATDRNRVDGRQSTTTDIYFMEVRPYDREYRQSEQANMPGGGGGGGFDSSLAQRQRDVIAATFKLVRDREAYSEEDWNENIATVALAQGRLREQVEALVARIRARGIVQLDSSFQAIIEALPQAALEMGAAEELLAERRPEEALSPEQRALQQLQRAEAAFREVEVSRNQGGGGGGGGQPNVEELAELFELELDQQRNQYESVQREQRQQVDQQIDETLQKLQELARRQQQENERLRAQANDSRNQAGSGGASQRQLAEEAEELARRLERLSREQSLPELNQTARELREAAERMRQAAANSRSGGLSEGLSALDRLREARRLLDENRAAGLERDVEDALRRAERLAEEQQQVIEDVERLAEGGNQSARLRRLMERKEEMAEETAELEADLDRLARESRSEQRDASRRLREAANAIRDDKLEDKIRYSRGVVQQRSPEYARNFEEEIAGDIEELRERIETARDAIGESDEQRLARTLDEARDLTRSLESLEERVQQQAEGAQQGEASGQQQGGQQQGAQGQSEQGRSRGEQRFNESSADGFPGFTPGDVRQFRREFRERRAEAERLQESLEAQGIDAGELEAVIDRLGRLESSRVWGDPKGLAELQAEVIQGLKEFEYVLRRQLGGGDERELLLTGSDDVPPGYRELVEEYYKALAEGKQR